MIIISTMKICINKSWLTFMPHFNNSYCRYFFYLYYYKYEMDVMNHMIENHHQIIIFEKELIIIRTSSRKWCVHSKFIEPFVFWYKQIHDLWKGSFISSSAINLKEISKYQILRDPLSIGCVNLNSITCF